MPILNAEVLTGADDGAWIPGGTFNPTGFSVAVGKSGANPTNGFFRFNNINMSASTVNTALFNIRAATTTSAAVVLRIYAIKEASPTAPISAADASSRPLTNAFVDWTPGAWVGDSRFDSPDISTVIQELVDEGYVYSGSQAIMLYILDNGSPSSTNRGIRTYEQSPTLSPARLTVDYASSNEPATIVANTDNTFVFPSLTPTLTFTGTDPEGENITYEVQISDKPDFSGNGSLLGDSYTPAVPTGVVHPNPLFATLTWQGAIQVDDRLGQGFRARSNGILDRARVWFGGDLLTNGAARVRVYSHQGTYGTSGMPLNPATAVNTPTPGWLAESELMPFSVINDPIAVKEFTFSGVNRIRLDYNQPYFLIVDWIPNTDQYDNTITCQADSALGAAGNAYIDGDSPNNGVNLTFDMLFQIYEEVQLLSAASDTNVGFLNQINPGDNDPFNSGQRIGYTVQTSLVENVIYYWRARARDTGSGVWSSYTPTRTFTVTDNNQPSDSSIASKTSITIGIGI